jgi:aminopeptidase N
MTFTIRHYYSLDQIPTPREEIHTQLCLWAVLPTLNGKIYEKLRAIKETVPLQDRKTAKLFNHVLSCQNIESITPYPLNENAKKEKSIFFEDHHPPSFLIPQTDLYFDVHEERTVVHAKLIIAKNHYKPGKSLKLDGDNLNLLSLKLNGQQLTGVNGVVVTPSRIIIPASLLPLGEKFLVETVVAHDPRNNFSQKGLFYSNGRLETLCEPIGFRKITYFIDRTDNPTLFTVEASLNKNRFPYFLSNGDQVERFEESEERYRIKVKMDYPISSYLFGFVAGNYSLLGEAYFTKSGKEIKIELYCNQGAEDKSRWLLGAAKQSLLWFEDTFGLEYKRQKLKLVCVENSLFGGMENEGLIYIHRTRMEKTSSMSPQRQFYSYRTIAHEIIHHWSGNGVMLPSYAHLGLKEGLARYLDCKFLENNVSRNITTFIGVVA